jgi:hypothetical protein
LPAFFIVAWQHGHSIGSTPQVWRISYPSFAGLSEQGFA